MYMGKKTLRGVGEVVEYTKEEIREYIRCKEDIIYFAEKYFYIVSIDDGKHKINLYDFQKKILKLFVGDEDNIILASRQIGKCFVSATKIKIRNKKTGQIKEISIEELFNDSKKLDYDLLESNECSNKQKIIESYNVDDWEVWTDDGWSDIQQVHKTIKYDVWEVKTKNHFLKCADEHIVIDKNYNQVYVKDLIIGNEIITESGIEKVTSLKKLPIDSEHMYDLSINSEKHIYFTNGILSHNSTISSVFILHYLIFNKNKTIAIMANKESAAKEILRRVKCGYESLPIWMQQGIVEWNKTIIELESGMRLIASTTSPDSISGETVSLLYMDEFAKVKPHIAEDFITATLPVVSSGEKSKIVIVSTAFGMNHFYSFWKKAQNRESPDWNGYVPIKVNWWDHPKRDEEWKKRTLRRMDNDIAKFNQEYGNRFLGSVATLLDPDEIERCDIREPIELKWNGLMRIYEQPIEKATYVMGVDTAKGTGGDYSVIQVLKIISEEKIKQVAVYRSDTTSPHDFAQVCIGISQYYNNAFMMIENNGIGDSVCSTIWYEYEYDYIINLDPKGLGVRSTNKSKLKANLLLKRYFDNKMLEICDYNTIQEFSRYVEVTPNVYKAESDSNDDCVTALLWALYFITTDYFDGKDISAKEIDDEYKLDQNSDDGPIMFLPDY